MDGLPQNPDAQRLAEMLRQQQMQQLMQKFQMNAPTGTDELNANLDRSQQPPMQDNMGTNLRIAGGQMTDMPVPQGVPQGFLNPQQQFQRGMNMTPLMIGADVPMGQGKLSGSVAGANVAAPGYNRTGINQVGLGYSAPVGGGTLSADVNVPTQGSNYNAMLRYNKRF